MDSIAPSVAGIVSPTNGGLYNTGTVSLSWNSVTDSGSGLPPSPYSYVISTNSGFTDTVSSGSTSSTSIALSLSDGTYFAKVQARDLVGNTSTSAVVSFRVLKVIDMAHLSTGMTSTGAIVFSGASSTGTTTFLGTGSLSIRSDDNSVNALIMSFSGLTVTTSGTGTWDGVIEPPKTVSLTGVVLSETGYTSTG